MLVRAIGAQHLCIDTGRRGTGAQDVQLDESAATKAGWDRAGQLLILQTQNARAGTGPVQLLPVGSKQFFSIRTSTSDSDMAGSNAASIARIASSDRAAIAGRASPGPIDDEK